VVAVAAFVVPTPIVVRARRVADKPISVRR
jgi:hypothetical protein